MRAASKTSDFVSDLEDESIYDDENIDKENPDEEQFRIQSSEKENSYVLVNTRIDYQYRSDVLDRLCLYDFVSTLYKKKINAADKKYLSQIVESTERADNRRGRPVSKRYTYRKEHPQATTHLMMEHGEPQVPVLFGPQVPRKDRDDTRERYCRALLTLFVPWRAVHDLCGVDQTWENAFQSRQSLIAPHSWKIIDNIQLLHECKKDRDEHLLQVIAEAQTEGDAVDPELLPENPTSHEEDTLEDPEDLLELLGQLDERTLIAASAKDSLEGRYVQETIEAVERVGRFTEKTSEHLRISVSPVNIGDIAFSGGNSSVHDNSPYLTPTDMIPFVPANSKLLQLNATWKDQLKRERDRVRQSLITGNHAQDKDALSSDALKDTAVTVISSGAIDPADADHFSPMSPLVSITTQFPSQKTIADEFTLNREQRAAFMIITSHLDGDARCHSGRFRLKRSNDC